MFDNLNTHGVALLMLALDIIDGQDKAYQYKNEDDYHDAIDFQLIWNAYSVCSYTVEDFLWAITHIQVYRYFACVNPKYPGTIGYDWYIMSIPGYHYDAITGKSLRK